MGDAPIIIYISDDSDSGLQIDDSDCELQLDDSDCGLQIDDLDGGLQIYDSDGGLQIDETSCSVDDDIRIISSEKVPLNQLNGSRKHKNKIPANSSKDSKSTKLKELCVNGTRKVELFHPKENSEPACEGFLEINGEPVDPSRLELYAESHESDDDGSLQITCDIAKESPEIFREEHVLSCNNGIQIRRSSTNDKSSSPILNTSLTISDDDYFEANDISFNKVPHLHVSVNRPMISQFSWNRVSFAVRQVEELFYMNRQCFICHALANDTKDLGLHMLKNHSGTTKGKWCHVCNQLVNNLFEHLQSHKNNLLQCSLCKSSCENFSNLRNHLLDHSLASLLPGARIMPKWLLCNKCPTAFPDEAAFNQHKILH